MVNLDWDKLKFEYQPVKSNLRYNYSNGQWDEGKLYTTYDVTLNVASNVLHYGQAIFEGLKAFQCVDGKVRIFRPQANAKRLNASASRLLMPTFPEEMFVEAVRKVVADNIEYVPPYGTGGALYIRPVMYGITPQIGVSPASDFQLVFIVVPVGAYYKGGIKPVDACVSTDFDRAAPLGTGMIKCAGNYASSLLPGKIAKEKFHCPVALFFDPKTHEYVDEFSTSNFLAITADGTYITPASQSILPSITNDSLLTVAADLGIKVERRPIHRSELPGLAEVAACGTAVVLTPVARIFDGDQVYTYGDEIGPVLKKLYDTMTGIQSAQLPDTHNWLVDVL